jgi:hypothetical protein
MTNRQISAISDPVDPMSAILDTGNAEVERQHQAINNQHGENGDILDQWDACNLVDVGLQAPYDS